MYYTLKQGQITPNIENKYVLRVIHLVAQCSKITNTVLFLKCILHLFSAFCCFLLVMSECPKVHFVALRFKSFFLHYILSPSPIISIRCYQLQDKKASVVDTTDLLCGTEKLNIK